MFEPALPRTTGKVHLPATEHPRVFPVWTTFMAGMMSGVLVVMSGLPGVGKSTLADALGKAIGAAVLSVDPIEAAMWRCGITRSTGVAAYEVAATVAEHQLSLGLSVIADSVSSVEAARDTWRRAAKRVGSELRVVEVTCSDPEVHRQRLADRRNVIAGLPEPSWDDVQRRRAEWEPWPEDRLVIDAMQGLAENTATALHFLGR